jgi:hypothetical protein
MGGLAQAESQKPTQTAIVQVLNTIATGARNKIRTKGLAY